MLTGSGPPIRPALRAESRPVAEKRALPKRILMRRLAYSIGTR
jgi:hypothetical protein